jgi:hypothetical protein
MQGINSRLKSPERKEVQKGVSSVLSKAIASHTNVEEETGQKNRVCQSL